MRINMHINVYANMIVNSYINRLNSYSPVPTAGATPPKPTKSRNTDSPYVAVQDRIEILV